MRLAPVSSSSSSSASASATVKESLSPLELPDGIGNIRRDREAQDIGREQRCVFFLIRLR